MASARWLCSGATGVSLAGHDAVAVSVQSDGVVCYDLKTQRPTRTWALGASRPDFTAPAAYDPSSHRFYAALQEGGRAEGGSLVSWPRDAEGGTITQLAQVVPLPAPAQFVVPVASAHPRRHPVNAAQTSMDVSSEQPAAFAVLSSGSVALCSNGGVLDEEPAEHGRTPLAADAVAGGLEVVYSGAGGKEAFTCSYAVQGSNLRRGPTVQLAQPSPKTQALSAASFSGRTAVLWSDGSLAVYAAASSSESSLAQPLLTRRLQGFRLPAPRLKGGKNGSAMKKRGLDGGDEDVASTAVASLGHGLLAVLGWSAAMPGRRVLRAVVIDSIYGCIQVAADLSPEEGDAGAGADPALGIQAACMSGSQLAVAAGGCAAVLSLELHAPTLANLIGALAVSSAAAEQAGSGAAAACATAAAQALHPSELQRLTSQTGAGARRVQCKLEAEAGAAVSDALLVPAEVRWTEPNAELAESAEGAAWAAVLDASDASLAKEAAFLALLKPLLRAQQEAGVGLSPGLLAKLLLLAAERRHWAAIAALLEAQAPGSLASHPGLAASLAAAHQYELLQVLLRAATDMPGDEVAALLKAMLVKSADPAARAAQAAFRARARAAAEAAVSAAEAAPGNEPSAEAALAAAACAAGAVDGLTPSQVCLNPLLAMRHDSGVLLGALRQLSSGQAVALLRHLRTLLRNYSAVVGDAHATAGALPPAVCLPPPLVVVEWVGLTVDANLTRLMLQPEAAPVLAEIQSLVESLLRALRRLSSLKGIVEHIRCGGALPAAQGSAASQYAIEWLDLRVRS